MCHRSTPCIYSRKFCPGKAFGHGNWRTPQVKVPLTKNSSLSLQSLFMRRYTETLYSALMPANTPELTADQRSKSGSYQRRAAQLFMYSYYSGRTENVTEGCCTHFLALTSLPFLEICKIQWTCNLCTSKCAQIHYVVRAVIGWDIKYTLQL